MSVAGTEQDFAPVLAAVAGVEGWMTDAQARRLWDGARRVAPGGRIVEIGSFRGRSTIVLASAAGRDVAVVAIDPHGGGDRGPNEITPDARARRRRSRDLSRQPADGRGRRAGEPRAPAVRTRR